MPEAIRLGGSWYIRADAERQLAATRTLKLGELFTVSDHAGDLRQHAGVHGLYRGSTRFLSRFELTMFGQRPTVLSSTVREGNDVLAVDLTNGDLLEGDDVRLRRESIHILRRRFLWDGVWHERLAVQNFEVEPVELHLRLDFAADWADIFEVRGTPRQLRGEPRPAVVKDCAVQLSYDGVDGIQRRTSIAFSGSPVELTEDHVAFLLALDAGERQDLQITIGCVEGGAPRVFPVGRQRAAYDAARAALLEQGGVETTLKTDNEVFDHWLNRSVHDLRMLVTETKHGPYPYAGTPWYSCPFGRDGLLTAFEMLWLRPELARGVLRYLAAEQATDYDPEHDAEPGKILHETRLGEMAATGEIPFRRYYGTVDATPLFVTLAGAYLQRTGDLDTVRRVWPAVEAGLEWMARDGDLDGDGFLEYARKGESGLVNQGWKDSYDSVSHADGRLATGPIALCEVQAYAYAAMREAARVALALGYEDRAEDLRERADVLKGRFERAFWSESLGMWALALDGEKRRCEVRSSNVGHCLAFGIATQAHADRVAEQLLDPIFTTGWGIRTLAATERRYNPMSYHNGSIWPHDNALCAYGLARYGHQDKAAAVLQSLYDASHHLDLNRLPELYCGFERRPGHGPTLYPVSCAPQAWAAGAVFLLLQATLGIGVDGRRGRVVLRHPRLPAVLGRLDIERLRVGRAELDLRLIRHGDASVGVHVLRRDGDCHVAVET